MLFPLVAVILIACSSSARIVPTEEDDPPPSAESHTSQITADADAPQSSSKSIWCSETPEAIGQMMKVYATRTKVAGLDRDGDRNPDESDLCPDQAEEHNDIEDMDGCPDHIPECTFEVATSHDILEATFRYQFENNASGRQQKAKAYFLKVFEHDPPPAFLARFSDHRPLVHKGSQFTAGSGLLFEVAFMRCPSHEIVEVFGGYYEGDLSSSMETYTLERNRDGWTVTGRCYQWIS